MEEANEKHSQISSKVDDLNEKIKEMIDGPRRKAKNLLDETIKKLETAKSGIYLANRDIDAAKK